jgi:hypothetical protein
VQACAAWGARDFSLAASDFPYDGHPFNVKLFEAKVVFRRCRSVSLRVVNRSQCLTDCVKSLTRMIARNCHRRAPSVRDVLCSPDALKETERTRRLALFTFDLAEAPQAYSRHVERVFNPDRKDHHWGRRKLTRER